MGEPEAKRTKLDAADTHYHQYSEDDGLQALIEWVVEAGGYISHGLELYRDKIHGYSAKVASHAASITSNRSKEVANALTLITCPTTRIFSLFNPEPDLPAAFLQSSSISQHAKACFHLCQHILLEEKSPFWPYLRLLPRSFNTPLYFTDHEMERLAGTNLGAGDVASRANIWKQEWETGLQSLRNLSMQDVDRYDWDLYLRAATIYTSRSFPSKLVLGTPATSATQTPWLGGNVESFPVLIPLVDILNHKPNTKIIWEPMPSSFSLKTTETLSIGAQIFNNYGPKANEELLMGYGFVILDNPVDSLAMKFTVAPRGPAAEIWQKRKSKEKWAPVFYLSKSARSEAHEDAKHIALENDWPDALVDLFRVLVANDYEIQSLQGGDPNQTPVSTRNELAVAIGLRAAITQKLSILRKFDKSTTTPQANDREKLADVYRQGQKDIMVSKIQNLDDFIKSYALGRRLSSSDCLAQHSGLASHLDEHPIPSEEYYDEDGSSVQAEIITKGELVHLAALLREYFARDSGSGNTSQNNGFWDKFVSQIMETPGLAFAETQQDVDVNEMEESEEQQIYQSLADYCNAVPGFFEKPLTTAHISWAWGIVRMKCIDLTEDDTVLTI
ncbi:hypothetical protein TWF696_002775 [Orbilia brochopaga]|uniref:SET domain-containing protein n=1 Tax=Orbilia brochopaga TaxID=3140254 RepID=A0AAV9U0N2_9PEZI